MSHLFILDRLYKWWCCWDVTNLLWSIPQMANCTCWSHGDPYVRGLANSKVIET